MPALTVVVPTYNAARYLPETLESILSQSLRDIEVLVVDDGSTDDTERVVAAMASDRVRYIRQHNSGGPAQPRNVGIRAARSKYVALCDADDVMLPGKLEAAVALLNKRPDLGLVFTNMLLAFEDGSTLPETFIERSGTFPSIPKQRVGDGQFVIASRDAYEALMGENFVGVSGIVAPREVFLAAGGFDETLTAAEDWDMSLRIARTFAIGYVDVVGHRYLLRRSGMTGQGATLMAPNQVKVLEKQLAKGVSSRARTRARRYLADVFLGLGYFYQTAGDVKKSRQSYLRSLKEAFTWRAIRGLLITWLSPRVVSALRTATARSN